MELRKLEERPRGMMWATTIMPQDAGGWHCTRMTHDHGGVYIKKHRWQNHRRQPYLTEWYEQVAA